MSGDRLKGKVALVTGGGSGIVRATCLLMAGEGARVAVADLDPGAAETVVGEIAEAGGEAVAVQGDVSSDNGAGAIVREALDRMGRIDVLVNSAGLGTNRPLAEITDEFVEQILSVNLKGTLFMAKHASNAMIDSEGGAIVNVASITATRPRPGMPVYAASKGAVASLTRALAIDLVDHGIRANCVSPGTTHTPMVDRHYANQPDADRRRQSNIDGIPLHREGEPSEIGLAILFLASDEASYVTGQVLNVDGGSTAGTALH